MGNSLRASALRARGARLQGETQLIRRAAQVAPYCTDNSGSAITKNSLTGWTAAEAIGMSLERAFDVRSAMDNLGVVDLLEDAYSEG